MDPHVIIISPLYEDPEKDLQFSAMPMLGWGKARISPVRNGLWTVELPGC